MFNVNSATAQTTLVSVPGSGTRNSNIGGYFWVVTPASDAKVLLIIRWGDGTSRIWTREFDASKLLSTPEQFNVFTSLPYDVGNETTYEVQVTGSPEFQLVGARSDAV